MAAEINHDSLNGELEQLDSESARLREERSFDALAALKGEKGAIKRLAEIDSALAQIAARRLTIVDGLAALDRQLRASLDAAERQRRLEKADRIETAIAVRESANSRLDAALADMAAGIKQWLAADRGLSAAGAQNSGWRPYQALSAAIYHHLAAGLGNEGMNTYGHLLIDCFPRNSLGSNHWRPISRDMNVESARSQVAELRR